MATTKWFDRKFDFNFGMERYTVLLERLKNAPRLYIETVASLPESILRLKPKNKWSIKEHIGHLLLLEPLWQKRFQEIKGKNAEMSPADLSNTATEEAYFNKTPLHKLTDNFMSKRANTIFFLDSLQQQDFSYSSIHPRLQNPMRVIDLMLFVAEHDDHHLKTIQTIINGYGK